MPALTAHLALEGCVFVLYLEVWLPFVLYFKKLYNIFLHGGSRLLCGSHRVLPAPEEDSLCVFVLLIRFCLLHIGYSLIFTYTFIQLDIFHVGLFLFNFVCFIPFAALQGNLFRLLYSVRGMRCRCVMCESSCSVVVYAAICTCKK